VRYKEVQLDWGYRLDLVIEDALIIALEAVPGSFLCVFVPLWFQS
jgi:hypothetical protein